MVIAWDTATAVVLGTGHYIVPPLSVERSQGDIVNIPVSYNDNYTEIALFHPHIINSSIHERDMIRVMDRQNKTVSRIDEVFQAVPSFYFSTWFSWFATAALGTFVFICCLLMLLGCVNLVVARHVHLVDVAVIFDMVESIMYKNHIL